MVSQLLSDSSSVCSIIGKYISGIMNRGSQYKNSTLRKSAMRKIKSSVSLYSLQIRNDWVITDLDIFSMEKQVQCILQLNLGKDQ